MKEVVAGIDIGGTNTIFGLVDKSGDVLAEYRIKTTDFPDIRKFIIAISDGINEMMKNQKDVKLCGIGIGAPNANYHKGTIELPPNLPWKGMIPFVDYLKSKVDVPVTVSYTHLRAH